MQVVRQASEGVFVPLTVGGGIREFTDADGKHWSALEVASEYFRSGADKVSIGGDAVFAAEEYRKTGKKTGSSSIEQISWVRACLLYCQAMCVPFNHFAGICAPVHGVSQQTKTGHKQPHNTVPCVVAVTCCVKGQT